MQGCVDYIRSHRDKVRPGASIDLGFMPEFIYVMSRARKAHGDKVILDEVTLSFLPGAKIGVVGPNGAGKSSVLKIMAGLDQPSNGEATSTQSPVSTHSPSTRNRYS